MKPDHVPKAGVRMKCLRNNRMLDSQFEFEMHNFLVPSHYMLTLVALLGADRRNLRLVADRLRVSANFQWGALSSPRSPDDAKTA